MLKKIGSWVGYIKNYVSNIQREVTELENETNDTSIDEINSEKKKK